MVATIHSKLFFRRMKSTPILHIGYPKTATTTLQNLLFARHHQIRLVGKPWSSRKVEEWATLIYGCDSLEYDSKLAQRGYDEHVGQHLNKSDIVVVSVELFCLPQHADRGLIANRLKEISKEATIIVCIREQLDYLPSFYRQQLSKHYTPSSFDNWIEASWNNRVNGTLHHLEYDKLVSCYQHLFGADSVHVFLYEQLRDDPVKFIDKLCCTLGIPPEEGIQLIGNDRENVARTQNEVRYNHLRRVILPNLSLKKYVPDLLRRYFLDSLKRGQKHRLEIPHRWQQPLRERYRQSNLTLVEKTGLPLKEYGYCL